MLGSSIDRLFGARSNCSLHLMKQAWARLPALSTDINMCTICPACGKSFLMRSPIITVLTLAISAFAFAYPGTGVDGNLRLSPVLGPPALRGTRRRKDTA